MENKQIKPMWTHPGGKLRRSGPASCSERELLAIILGKGSAGRSAQEIATEVLDKYVNLNGLMGITLREMMEIKGLKAVKVTQIAAVFEICRRILKGIERE